MYHYHIPFCDLDLTTQKVLREMGYTNSVRPANETQQMVDSILKRVGEITSVQCAFAIYQGSLATPDTLVIHRDMQADVTLEVGATIAGLMKGVERMCIFTATAGAQFEAFQQSLKSQGDMIEIFIVDMIGSCIAERAGDIAERHLENLIAADQHTHRFSPGYCGWHLSEQHKIFSMLDPTPCGITLSDVSLMLPIKSISGFIGIGRQVNQKQYGCQFCELKTCYKRKRIET